MRYLPTLLKVVLAATPIQAMRNLRAARHIDDISRRAIDVPLKKSLELSYVEAMPPHGVEDNLGAHLQLESKSEILVLEDIEHLLEDIDCEVGGRLHLRFLETHFLMAREKLVAGSELLVVTSHHGCNEPGERLPYRVHDIQAYDTESTLTLEVGAATWHEDFDSSVRFGPIDSDDYRLNQHYHLMKRRGSKATKTEEASPTFPHATSDPTATDITAQISKEYKNTKIIPPSIGDFSLNLQPPGGLSVTCADCKINGSLYIAHGYFKAGDGGFFDFIEDGYVSVAANYFSTLFSLQSTIGPSLPPLNVALSNIALDPFHIPGVANVGVSFRPAIEFSAGAAVNTTINYGFNLTVPDHSEAIISIGNITNSTDGHWKDTSLDALPFSADLGKLSVNMSVAFKPTLQLGISLFSRFTGAELFLDLPKLTLEIDNLDHTDTDCKPLNKNKTDSAGSHKDEVKDPDNILTPLFGDLILFKPSVAIDFGVDLDIADIVKPGATFASAATPLPTACYAFDKDKKTMIPAAQAASSVSSSMAAAASASRASAASKASKASKAAAAAAHTSSKNAAAPAGGHGVGGLRCAGGWLGCSVEGPVGLMVLALSFALGVAVML